MIKYDALHGGDDAGACGIYDRATNDMVLSAYALNRLGHDLMRVIVENWSDDVIDALIAKWNRIRRTPQ